MPETTRQEHIRWVKQRAIELVEQGNLLEAINSIAVDLLKHPETQRHLAPELATQLYIAGALSTPQDMVKFIEGIG